MADLRIWKHIAIITLISVLLNLLDRTIAQLDGYTPGEDYPAYEEVPQGLSFTCADKIPGYYADPETQCQVWHWCVPGIGGNIMYSFICGPGTVFNQRTRVCDWFFKVDCPNAQAYYGVNEDLYKDEAGNFIAGKKKHSYDTKHDKRRVTARNKRQEYAKSTDKKRVHRQIRTRRYSTLNPLQSTYSTTVSSLQSTYSTLSDLKSIHSTVSPFRSTFSVPKSTSNPKTYKGISSIFSSIKEIDF